MKNHILYFLGLSLLSLSFIKCTEPYKLESTNFEEALVVEGLITNELSYQKVKLSRVIRLEEVDSNTEQNAQVWVEDSNQNRYDFSESELGAYRSNEEFKAEANTGYKLFIQTADGNQYESREEYLTPEAVIDNLYAEEEILNGVNGVQVYIDSSEDVGLAKYFRYEFAETFKVITPYNIFYDVNVAVFSQLNFDINFDFSDEQENICYTTKSQTQIIQANITNSTDNGIEKFPIRFIHAEDYSLTEKYSILVSQYNQSFDAYNYYNTLNELGSFESLLVESQTGFVSGNISNSNNSNEKVIGFFEVSSVASERIFFNYSDFNYEKPNYPYTCDIDTLDYRDATSLDGDRNDRIYLYNHLVVDNPPWELLNVEYEYDGVDPLTGEDIFIPIYILLKSQCGNCTTFSTTNIQPEFWED